MAKMKLPTTANWAAGAEDIGKRNRQESGELSLAEIQVRVLLDEIGRHCRLSVSTDLFLLFHSFRDDV